MSFEDIKSKIKAKTPHLVLLYIYEKKNMSSSCKYLVFRRNSGPVKLQLRAAAPYFFGFFVK